MIVQASVHDYVATVYDAHLAALRGELRARRAIAFAAIDEYWPLAVRVVRSGGGYYLWGTARDYRARALLDACERSGASFLFGEPFFAQGGGDFSFRLALTPVARTQIAEGIRRIGLALRA